MLVASSPARRRLSLGTRLRWHQAGETRHAAQVTVGGPSRRFEPHAYSQKWNDEAWMTLLFPELTRDLQRPTFGGNLAEVVAAGDRQHRYFVDDDGNLEYELVLGVKPASNVFDFHIDFPAKLDFFYQPPLNQEDYSNDPRVTCASETEAYGPNGVVRRRPADIVGSYAVYWHKSNNQYQTGKLCHIKRPRFIDALGRWTWGDLKIDTDRKRLRITAPERWLARAIYPVTLDPTLGYASIGGSTDQTDDYSLYTPFTAGSSFDAATLYIGCSCDSGTQTVKGAGYTYGGSGNPAGETRLSTSVNVTATTSMGFQSGAVTWAGITSSTQYTLGMAQQAGGNSAYDSSTGTIYYHPYGGVRPTFAQQMFDPTTSSWEGNFGGRISVYVESGGAATTRGSPFGQRGTAFNGGRVFMGIIR